MEIIDTGHKALLTSFDGNFCQVLTFVKRKGPNYPGNTTSYPGTITQEVLRVLIHRTEYVQNQKFCPENVIVRTLLITCLFLLEHRHQRKHNINKRLPFQKVHLLETCPKCGHIHCHCQNSSR